MHSVNGGPGTGRTARLSFSERFTLCKKGSQKFRQKVICHYNLSLHNLTKTCTNLTGPDPE
jgi:hypothetical protein